MLRRLVNAFKKTPVRDRSLMVLLVSLILVLVVGARFVFDQNRVYHLTIAAGSSASESYQLSQAIAQKVESCTSRIKLHVLETKGSDQNIELLQNN